MGPPDVQRALPAERWDIDRVYAPDILPGKMSVNVRCSTGSFSDPGKRSGQLNHNVQVCWLLVLRRRAQ